MGPTIAHANYEDHYRIAKDFTNPQLSRAAASIKAATLVGAMGQGGIGASVGLVDASMSRPWSGR